MKKIIYYLDFNIKPVLVKKGYVGVYATLSNREKLITVEHKGAKNKIPTYNIYYDKKEAEDRLKEYNIIKKFKKTHDHRCKYCGKFIIDEKELTVDHIVPKDKGGKTEERNLCISCKECNEKKTNDEPFNFINKEIKIQRKKEKGNKRKIGRNIKLTRENVEYIAKHDSRVWNLNFFHSKNPYRMAKKLGC